MDKKYCFIIGAGASKELMMPSTEELSNEIKRFLIPNTTNHIHIADDQWINIALNNWIEINTKNITSNKEETIEQAKKELKNAMSEVRKNLNVTRSIDSYIETHSTNKYIETCAKLGIARTIVEYEKNNFSYQAIKEKKFPNEREPYETWILKFFHKFARGNIKKLKENLNNFIFIIFNYDRCFEQFMLSAFKDLYSASGIKEHEIIETVRSINICHPYGCLGSIFSGDDDYLKFGEDSLHDLLKISQRIQTIRENEGPASSIESYLTDIHRSDFFIFLGFSYDIFNRKLLYSTERRRHSSTSISSSFGKSKSDMNNIANKIFEILGTNPKSFLHDRNKINEGLKCYEVFEEYDSYFDF